MNDLPEDNKDVIVCVVHDYCDNDGWIPMAERQPEEGQKVLATIEYTTDKELEVIVGNYDSHTAIWRKLMKAWMPCPEPYKKER